MKTKINLEINTSVNSGKKTHSLTHTYTFRRCVVIVVATVCFHTQIYTLNTNHTKPYVYTIFQFIITSSFFLFDLLLLLLLRLLSTQSHFLLTYSICCFSFFFIFYFRVTNSLLHQYTLFEILLYANKKLFVTKISWKFFNHRSQFPSLWKEGEREKEKERENVYE